MQKSTMEVKLGFVKSPTGSKKKKKKKVELSEKKIKMADLSPNVLIIIINSNGLNTLSINQS